MTTATLTLAEQLLAWIAEDEAVARGWHDISCQYDPGYSVECDCDVTARVLATCAAHRAIVGMWTGYLNDEGEVLGGQGPETHYDVLKYLAQPYADYPEFREEWRA